MFVAHLTFAACNADALSLDLKAQTTLIFPQRRSHARLHSRWRNLTGVVERMCLVTLCTRNRWRLRTRHCYMD
jgi:hypothetical protein